MVTEFIYSEIGGGEKKVDILTSVRNKFISFVYGLEN